MNEFVAKKLAEVQAFVDLKSIIIERASKIFLETAPRTSAVLKEENFNLIKVIADNPLRGAFRAKTQRTTGKLTKMMDLYIGDAWDNPVEVLEWLSFYCGAAAAHAALVAATLDELSMPDEKNRLQKIHDTFWQALIIDKEELAATGVKRITA